MPAATELDCITLVNSPDDLARAADFYPGAFAARVSFGSEDKVLTAAAEKGIPLWIDAATEGFHLILKGPQSFEGYKKAHADYQEYKRRRAAGTLAAGTVEPKKPPRIPWMERYAPWAGVHDLGRASFVAKPDAAKARTIVKQLLDKAAEFNPTFVSVPQLPFDDGSARNRINVSLAKAAATWRSGRKGPPSLILPAIITHKRQTLGKTQWGKKVEQIRKCLDQSRAKVLWVVDASLDDADGKPSDQDRLCQLVELHKHLRSVLPADTRVIAGPYWGMNLILWARGLSDNPVVSLGFSSQFMIPGNPLTTPSVRVILRSLRRKATANAELRQWLIEAADQVEQGGTAYKEFRGIADEWERFGVDAAGARKRLLQHYASWVTEIQATPDSGRAMGLFHQFTAAYALGANLPVLPESERPARSASQIAEQLMMRCLS